MANYQVNINNTSSETLDIYTFQVSSSSSEDYPDYVKVGEIAASSQGTYKPKESLENLYFVSQTDGMPLLNTVTALFSDTVVTISDDNLTDAQDAFNFYQAYTANPSSKDASAINDIINSASNVTDMETQINEYLADNGYSFDYATFTAVSFWAQNDARAWAQNSDYKLYVYDNDNPSVEPSLITLSTTGAVTYQKFNGFETGGDPIYENAVTLNFSRNMVTSDGATANSGTYLTGTVVDLTDVDQAGSYGLFLVGTQDGDSITAQPYEVGSDKTYSLTALCKNIGIDWPSGAPGVVVSDYYYSSSDGVTVVSGKLDITKVSFDDGVLDNVLDILSSTTYEFTIELDAGANLGAGTIELKLDADEVKIPLGDSNYLTLEDSKVLLSINALFAFVVFEIKTTLPFTLFDGPTFDAELSMTVDSLEAQIGVVISSDASLNLPAIIQGVYVDEIGVSMGLFFKPSSYVIGVTTEFHIGDDSNNEISLDDDTLTVVCQIVDEIPNPLYISFYVPQLDLDEILEIFTNTSVNTDIPISFSDLSFIWVENPLEPVALPDGSLSSFEYGFSAYIDLFGLKFYGSLEINLTDGIQGTITMSPFSMGESLLASGESLLALKGDGEAITVKVDSDGNIIKNNYVPTTTEEQDEVDNATTKEIISAGGPEMTITTSSSPYFTLDAELDFLEFSDSIDAKIGSGGISFDLDFGATVISSKMSCVLKDYQNFTGTFTFGPDWSITLPTVDGIKLGTLTVDVTVSATLTIAVSSSEIDFSVSGSFDLLGLTRSIGPATLDVDISKLSDVISNMATWVEDHVETVFRDIIRTAEKWIDAINDDILKPVAKDVATISKDLKAAFSVSISDVGSLVKSFDYDVNDCASAFKAVFDPVANDMSNALEDACDASEETVASAMNSVGYRADEIAGALSYTFDPSEQEVAQCLKDLGYDAEATTEALESAFEGISASTCNAVLQAVGYSTSEIEKAFNEIGGDFEDYANEAWKETEHYMNPSNW